MVASQLPSERVNPNWNVIFTPYLRFFASGIGWIEFIIFIFQRSLSNPILPQSSPCRFPVPLVFAKSGDFGIHQDLGILESGFDQLSLGVHPTRKNRKKVENDAFFQESASSSNDPFWMFPCVLRGFNEIQAYRLIEASGANATRHPDISAWHKPWPALGLRHTKKKLRIEFRVSRKKIQVLVENLAQKKQKHHKMLYKTCTENHSRWFSTKRSSDFFCFFLVVPRQHGSGHDGCKWRYPSLAAFGLAMCFSTKKTEVFGTPNHLVAWPKPLYPDSQRSIFMTGKSYTNNTCNHYPTMLFMSWCLKGKAEKNRFQTCRQSPCSSFVTPERTKTISFHLRQGASSCAFRDSTETTPGPLAFLDMPKMEPM